MGLASGPKQLLYINLNFHNAINAIGDEEGHMCILRLPPPATVTAAAQSPPQLCYNEKLGKIYAAAGSACEPFLHSVVFAPCDIL